MLILGIVGSPAGGKSTVAKRLEGLGGTWINADLVARSVLHEPDVIAQLVSRFGSEIANSEGQIDRPRLASVVFGDDDSSRQSLAYLESVVHPRTRQLISDRIREVQEQNPNCVIILDVPLMFESGWDRSCDEILCVDSEFENRVQRVKERGWDRDELLRREANQLDIQQKKWLSTIRIENNGTLEALNETIDRLWSSLYERQLQGVDSNAEHCN